MNPLRFTRRNLLRGGLSATALIPLLETERAWSQEAYPTRFVVMSYPNGTRGSMFWPTGTETNFTMKEFTKSLEPFKSKLTFLKGVKLNQALQQGNLMGNLGSEHARGTGGMLTGRPLNAGKEFVSFGNTTSGWGSGQSIDQFLATKLNPNTTHKTLHIGSQIADSQVRARISYTATNQPVSPRLDPKDIFNTLFGKGADNRLSAQRKKLMDLNNAEVTRLKGIVSSDDRVKLDAHLTSMLKVEARLAGMPNMMGGTGPKPNTSCMAPTLPSIKYEEESLYQEVGRLQMDMLAAALACDQTRIATFQWSYSESEHHFPFLNISGDHHGISHDFAMSGPGFDGYNKIQTWYQEQFAYFLAKLDSYKEGDRTLLDNTLVLWATEIGESRFHDLTTMPYVFAGSAGGKIKAGRLLDWSSSQKDNNQMLVSIAHAMGVTDVMEFGDPSGAKGPLPGLT